MGFCWLTRTHSFLVDYFEQHVSSVLLRPDGAFAALALGHEKFLSYLHLEYHRTTRAMIQ